MRVLFVCPAPPVTLLTAKVRKTSLRPKTGSESDTVENIKYVYKTKYIDVQFASEEQKNSWKSALVSLLNNEKSIVYDENDHGIGYSYLYPDRPCIEIGYQLALFDFNSDGTPELLVNAGGGSAGNAFYFVYDIVSGKELGTLDGGHDNSWCVYFNQLTGKFEAIGHFEWRSGWMGKSRHVSRASLASTVGLDETYLIETSLMSAYYEINAVNIDSPYEESEHIYTLEEIYTGVTFYVDGNIATIEEYFAAQDRFTENFIRITETAIRLIDWDDVTDEGDDVATKAEKMAQALISSDQEFVISLP